MATSTTELRTRLLPDGWRPGDRWRAPFSSDPHASRGRRHSEPVSPSRTEFQRDRDRIIHSTAFRRLKHKTQVFVEHEGDHYRTRLTHTIEVAQIARSIARALGLDEDLAETLALAHDLGHSPFGHAGERALDRKLSAFGGFDHNAQSLKIVTSLERRYADFDGLNLTFETLEGLVKHNGPLTDRDGVALEGALPATIASYDRQFPLDLWSQASAEAQAAAIADDIAYNAHDLDDGLRAGILDTDALREVPFLAAVLESIEGQRPNLDQTRTAHELQRRVITAFVEGAISEAWRRLEALDVRSPQDVRNAASSVVAFPPEIAAADRAIKAFLYPRLYRSVEIMTIMDAAEVMVEELFDALLADPQRLPADWRQGFETLTDTGRVIRVADYIAGMTDRYARDQHRALLKSGPV